MGTTKNCCVCGLDVSGQKRVKDAYGRYYCHPCYHATAQAVHEPSDKPADPYAVAESDYSHQPEPAAVDELMALAAAATPAPAWRRRYAARPVTSRSTSGADGKLLIKILAVCGVIAALGIIVAVLSQGRSGGGGDREEHADVRILRFRNAGIQEQVDRSERDTEAHHAAKETERRAEADDEKRRISEAAAAEAMAAQVLKDRLEGERLIKAQIERERQEDAREPPQVFDAGNGIAYGEVRFTDATSVDTSMTCRIKIVNRTGRDVSSVFFKVRLLDANGSSLETSGTGYGYQVRCGETCTCSVTLMGWAKKSSDFARYEVTVWEGDISFRRKLERWQNDK